MIKTYEDGKTVVSFTAEDGSGGHIGIIQRSEVDDSKPHPRKSDCHLTRDFILCEDDVIRETTGDTFLWKHKDFLDKVPTAKDLREIIEKQKR